jgi:hypothetical protein
MIISHGSGSGFALDVIKAGSGEAIRVTKTSGSGNAMTVIGGNFEAPTIVKTGGTSTQYLMANGSVSTLTNPVTGTGTTNYLPKFTGSTTVGNSQIFDDGTRVFINATTAPALGSPRLFVKMATSNSFEGILVASSTNNNVLAFAHTGSVGLITTNYGTSGANTPLAFGTDGVAQMTLSTSGNLGLGVTPSAWFSTIRAIQIGSVGGAFITGNTGGGGSALIGLNAHFDQSTTSWIYGTSNQASYYQQTSGEHRWLTAPSGTAGNAITFTQAMTLTSGGNLLVGTTTDAGQRLQVNGRSTFTGVSGETINATGVGNEWVQRNVGSLTTGQSYGMTINAGTNSSDVSFNVSNTANTINYFRVRGDGNVGINTASPEGKLTVEGTSAQPPTSGTTANSLLQLKGSLGNELNIGSNTVAGNYGAYIQASDNNLAVPYQLNLQPNGGNVIIGGYTDAGFRLDVNGTGRFSAGVQSIGTEEAFRFQRTIGTASDIYSLNADSGSAYLYNNTTAKVLMNWSEGGNVGIGVTPNSWAGTNVKALEVYLASMSASLTYGTAFTFNTFYDGNWKYIGPYTAGRYEIGGDEHIWSNAPSGSAGATATFTTRMKISSAGNVLIGTTTDSGQRLQVSGAISVNTGVIASTTAGIRLIGNSNNNGGLQFSTSTSFQIFGGSDYGGIGINTLGTGIVYSNGSILTNTNPSDVSLKNTINPLNYGLVEIMKLKPKTFYYNSDVEKKSLKYGFIAQEVQDIMPDLVRKISEYDDRLGIESDGIYVAMVKAIQELKSELDELKGNN